MTANNNDTDFGKLEQYHYELHNELILKRSQLNEVREMLDSADIKIYKLNRELELYKVNLKESQSNFNILSNSHKAKAEEIKQLKEELANTKLKDEILELETDALNKYVQQLIQDKNNLNNKIEDLEARCKCYLTVQNEFNTKSKSLNDFIEKTKIAARKFEQEAQQLNTNFNKINLLQNSLDHSCLAENKKLKAKIDDMEKDLIKVSAKCKKYEELNKNFNEDIWMIAYSQWKVIIEQCNQQIKNDQDLIKKLTDALSNETLYNAKLILQNEANEELIKKLQDKLKQS